MEMSALLRRMSSNPITSEEHKAILNAVKTCLLCGAPTEWIALLPEGRTFDHLDGLPVAVLDGRLGHGLCLKHPPSPEQATAVVRLLMWHGVASAAGSGKTDFVVRSHALPQIADGREDDDADQ